MAHGEKSQQYKNASVSLWNRAANRYKYCVMKHDSLAKEKKNKAFFTADI